jgi:NADPH-dependent ferric siderophore reductase
VDVPGPSASGETAVRRAVVVVGGAALERLPAGARALVFAEVAGAAEEQPELASRDGVRLVWVHRGDAVPGQALVAAVRGATLPEGIGHLFVHGEAGAVRELRRHLRAQRGLRPEFTSISGYWRRGDTEERWQTGKREWNAAIEAEEAAVGG